MSERRWDFYVRDMLECCRKVTDYVSGLDRAAFLANDLVYEAVLWNLATLGEAANNVPEDVREAHEAIPWHAIIGLRNRIVHGYGVIDDQTVWEVIQAGVPELMPQLSALLDEA
jgi:uncharacterized protein with HEPN domain